MFAALPMPHVMGLMVTIAALCGGIPLLRRDAFDPQEALDIFERDRPNIFVGVPTMYADMEAAGASTRDLSSVQIWVSAADVMPLDRARRFQGYGAMARIGGRPIGSAAFLDIYGMVELSGGAAVRVLPPSPVGAMPAPQVAHVLPGFEVRAIDGDGQVLPSRKKGELQFRGPGSCAATRVGPTPGPTRTDGCRPVIMVACSRWVLPVRRPSQGPPEGRWLLRVPRRGGDGTAPGTGCGRRRPGRRAG
jgi:acyl-CoA synthetase (AMP-forming)/AMP-acid ligase II